MNVKMNMKGIYDTYECEVCLMESQKHVYECKEIWKKKERNDEHIPKYEKLIQFQLYHLLLSNKETIYKREI